MTDARRLLAPGALGDHLCPLAAMPADCQDCPFKMAEAGRSYLTRERLEGILFASCLGQPFWCHKTIYQDRRTEWRPDADGDEAPAPYQHHYRVCAGALRWVRLVAAGRDPLAEYLTRADPAPDPGRGGAAAAPPSRDRGPVPAAGPPALPAGPAGDDPA